VRSPDDGTLISLYGKLLGAVAGICSATAGRSLTDEIVREPACIRVT
jgi:hypothetical protein